MNRNAHLHRLDSGEVPASEDQVLLLSQQLALAGENDQAADVASAAYDRSITSGNQFIAGQAAGLVSYTLAQGDIDHTAAVDYGEKSQEALPYQPAGDNQPIIASTAALRFGGASRVLLSNRAPKKAARQELARRAIDLIDADLGGHTEHRKAIVHALIGRKGASIALAHAMQGITQSWKTMPSPSNPAKLARHASREAAISGLTFAFVAPQALGRLALPLRAPLRPLANQVLGSTKPHLVLADPAITVPRTETSRRS